jgi:hypothetical protein
MLEKILYGLTAAFTRLFLLEMEIQLEKNFLNGYERKVSIQIH